MDLASTSFFFSFSSPRFYCLLSFTAFCISLVDGVLYYLED